MWSAIKELHGDVPTYISQQGVVAHSQRVRGLVAARVPRIHGSHGASIWSDERGDRKDTMTVVAAACCESRNYSMAQSRKYTLAFTAVVQRVFFEGLGEGIARRRGYRCDAEVGSKSFCVAFDSLFPLRRSVLPLVNARC